MTDVTAKLRNRARSLAALAAGCTLAVMSLAQSADARPYTVVACDSAPLFGYSAAAWTAFGNAGSAYAACPTGGGSTAGISNRLIGATYTGFSHSGHVFAAPPGATITHVRWAGRMAREGCQWGTYFRAIPSGAPIVGLPHGQHCSSLAVDNRGWPLTFPVPEGATRIEQLVFCGAAQCQPGATLHSHLLELTVDDPVPPSISLDGPLASGQWVSGRVGQAQVTVVASDNAGIQSIETTVGERSETHTYPCNWSQARPCTDHARTAAFPVIADLVDGRHALRVSAKDAAGSIATETRDLYVDNTAPDPVVPRVSGGNVWHRTNGFAVSWTSPPSSAAPIVRAHWKICTNEGDCLSRGHHDDRDVQQLPILAVPGPGDYRLYVWLEDAAGNQREENAAVSAPLRFDPEPPDLTFEPPDPADPLRVVVTAVDRHSGLARGEIEMRAAGTTTWHGLVTERHGSTLVAQVDDEQFRNGNYEFRAHAVDEAGNEASTGKRSDGSAAMIRLPARIETRLTVGLPRVVVRRTVVRRHGRREVIRRRVRRLDHHVVAGHGRVLRLRGSVANSDGQPIGQATVEAVERRPDGNVVLVGLATTGADGKFHYVVRATKNRELAFRYGGSRRIASASAALTVSVPAESTIRTDSRRVLNGQQVVFSGRVTTRPLRAEGKLVEMQAHFRGRWRTFSTVRTDADGRWRFPYRFGATVGRVTYQFRAMLPAEGGYPFIGGHSGVVKVIVLGA